MEYYVIHAEANNQLEGQSGYHEDSTVMICGLWVIFDEDGTTHPDTDFYTWNARHKATCLKCNPPAEAEVGSKQEKLKEPA